MSNSPILWGPSKTALSLVPTLVLPGSTSGTLSLSPAAATTSYSLTMPGAQATGSGQTLVNNGSGTLAWGDISALLSLGPVGSSPNANAATLSAGVLSLQPASASFPGVVTTGTQTFAGSKTFSSAPTLSSITAAEVLYTDTGGLVSGSSNLTFSNTLNGFLGLGTNIPPQQFTIFSTNNTTIESKIYSGATSAGPGTRYITDTNSAVVSGTGLGQVMFWGSLGSGGLGAANYGMGAYLLVQTTQNWAVGAHGAQLQFWTTPNGTISQVNALTLDQDQGAYFGGVIGMPNNVYLKIKNSSGSYQNILTLDSSNNTFLNSGGSSLYLNANNTTDTFLNSNNTGTVYVGNGSAFTSFVVQKGALLVTSTQSGNVCQGIEVGGTMTATAAGSVLEGVVSQNAFAATASFGVATGAAFLASPRLTGNAGTITNLAGYWYDGGTTTLTGTVTNSYGLYIQAPAVGTNKYGAYIAANVGIGTTSPNAALSIGNNVYTAPLGSSYSQFQIILFDGGNAGGTYGMGVESFNIGFNSNGGYKFYQQGGSAPILVVGGSSTKTVGIGISTSLGAGLDVETAVNTNTIAKFGNQWPVYANAGSASYPTVGFNISYSGNWLFGKGSTTNYGSIIQGDPTNGSIYFGASTNSGTAGATATVTTFMAMNRSGQLGIGSNPLSQTRTLTLTGTANNITGPHIHAFISSDLTYPVWEQLNWNHDNINQQFDAYYNGANWISCSSTNNFQIAKSSGAFKINWSGSVAAGSSFSWTNGFTLTGQGVVGLNNTTSPRACNVLDIHKGDPGGAQTVALNQIGVGDYLSIGHTWSNNCAFIGINCFLQTTNSTGNQNIWAPVYPPGQGLLMLQDGGGNGSLRIYGANWNSTMSSSTNQAGMVDVLYLKYNGNVGIGTNSPNYPLHINPTGASAAMMLTSQGWAPGSSETLYFGDTNHYIQAQFGVGLKLVDANNIYLNSLTGSIYCNSGQVTTTSANLYATNSTGTLSAAFNTVVYTSVTRDSTSAYNSSTGAYTCNQAGVYSCTASAMVTGTYGVGTTNELAIYVNGVLIFLAEAICQSSLIGTLPVVVSTSCLILNANDVVTIRLWTNVSSPSWNTTTGVHYFTLCRTGN